MRNSSSSALRGPLPCSSVWIGNFERDSIVNQTHLLITGEQDKSPAPAVVRISTISSAAAAVNAGLRGSGSVLWHVEQRLLSVIEMARDDECARIAQAQPLLGEFKLSRDGERGRSQHGGINRIEQFSSNNCATSIGVACKNVPRPRRSIQ